MSLSPRVESEIAEMEKQLSQVDPTLRAFCSRHGYRFSSFVGVWPRRRAWVRDELDRALDLTMDLNVPEFMERGFYPEMPWSLYATASLPVSADDPIRLLSVPVFRGLPFTQLADALADRLEKGAALLRGFTRDDVLTRGECHGHGTA